MVTKLKLLTVLNGIGLAALAFVGANPALPEILLALFPAYAKLPIVGITLAIWGALVRYAQVRDRKAAAEYAVRRAQTENPPVIVRVADAR